MKIERLIGIITILLQQDKVTAPQLAERFEVSKRTINRDIEDICKAGIPLVTTQGYCGGISIMDGYKIDKTLFTQEELQHILMGLKGIDSVSKASYQTKILDKFQNKNAALAADNIMIINLASHYQSALTEKIDLIKRAILKQRRVSFKYYYEKGEQVRTLAPYHLVFQWSSWYLFGYCVDRKAYRLFKLNRLWDLQITTETYSPRKIPQDALDFDTYFSSHKIHLKAHFAETEKHRLIDEYGVNCYTALENGSVLFERDFVNYENMRQWVFSFGDKVTVLAPKALQADQKKQAKNILNS